MVVMLLSAAAALISTVSPPASNSTHVIDPALLDRAFDGHGGLSAGASSRLLYDYDPAVRSDILDYLYLPSFGAQLTICKVEIGGDVQSTNGAEASHMHTSKDLNYHRGYEYWLMTEAKKRNPAVRTYVLSWGVPGWVGDGNYFSAPNIVYQTNFVKGARDAHNLTIDYIGAFWCLDSPPQSHSVRTSPIVNLSFSPTGIWNERPWGNVAYVKSLRSALDASGFQHTQIVGSDGGIPSAQINFLATDPAFAAAEHIQGTHYPCSRDQPAKFWEIVPKQTYWANEDFSTIGGDWDGGSCWGRSLSQNFVKLNATATISWSTIWSVYDSWRYFGNGLMYAMEPWSGNYTVPPAIWTSAHVNQFVEPGWHFLSGGGNGLLPGGGSWTAMVPGGGGSRISSSSSSSRQRDQNRQLSSGQQRRIVGEAIAGLDLTLVVEKLEGACLRCKVASTTAETVSFKLAGTLTATKSLSMWLTNGTVSFMHMGEVAVSDGGVFSVHVPRDTMITLSTTTGQAKGQASTCTGDTICSGVYKPFPFPFTSDYESGEIGRMAKFHADNAGAFEIRADAADADAGGGGKHLFQASPRFPAGTEWASNFDPITSLGATDWVNYGVAADIMLMPVAPAYSTGDPLIPFPTTAGMLTDKTKDPISTGVYGGVCVRQIDQYSSGFCLLVGLGLLHGGPDNGSGGVGDNGTETGTDDSVDSVDSNTAAAAGWVLQAGAMHMARAPGTILASGTLSSAFSLSSYHRLSLRVNGQKLQAAIDNKTVVAALENTVAAIPPVGQAALRSSFSYTQFDNLKIDGDVSSAFEQSVFAKHLLYPPKPAPGGPQDPSEPLTVTTPGSEYGISFTVGGAALEVTELARFGAGFVANSSHMLSIVDANSKATLGTATVVLGKVPFAKQGGGDLNGYVWAPLAAPLTLAAGKSYYLVSSEGASGSSDVIYDGKVWMQAQPGLLSGLPTPVYKDATGWHVGGGQGGQPVPMPRDRSFHYITSKSTSECFDTRGNALDLWACVGDGHNELFNYSSATGRITTGPGDADKGGHCVTARVVMPPSPSTAAETAVLPVTSSIEPCTDATQTYQKFSYHHENGTLTLRDWCFTAGPKGMNAGVTVTPCTGAPNQQWSFTKAPHIPPAPPAPPPPAPKMPEWGQGFGPLNLKIKTKVNQFLG